MNHAFSSMPIDFSLRQKADFEKDRVEIVPVTAVVDVAANIDENISSPRSMMSSQTTCAHQDDDDAPRAADSVVPGVERGPSPRSTPTDAETEIDKTTGPRLSFVESLNRTQSKINQEFEENENRLHTRMVKGSELSGFGWDELEAEYQRESMSVAEREVELMAQFDIRFQQFMLWMQVSNERETARASKRLKTQAALVQNSEKQLAEQQQHYDRVMDAFQGAMQLLSQR